MSPYHCPICTKSLRHNPRYPRYVCPECADKATDAAGRKLEFYNVDLSGGFIAKYAESGEPYDSHECYIDGIPCVADEARFGGIVIELTINDE